MPPVAAPGPLFWCGRVIGKGNANCDGCGSRWDKETAPVGSFNPNAFGLDNHYHLLAQSRRGLDLPRIVRAVHGRTGFAIHGRTGCDLRVWWNYWDYCPRDERDYYRHLNYLLWNPVKHGYVTRLRDWPHSSFHSLLDKFGAARLRVQFRDYPDFRELAVEDDF